MAVLELGSWAIFGASVHGLAQGLRHKPLNHKPIGFVLSAAAFVGVGLVAQSVRGRQLEFLNTRVDSIKQERLQRGVDFERK